VQKLFCVTELDQFPKFCADRKFPLQHIHDVDVPRILSVLVVAVVWILNIDPPEPAVVADSGQLTTCTLIATLVAWALSQNAFYVVIRLKLLVSLADSKYGDRAVHVWEFYVIHFAVFL
jgi:hypothetical protein